MSDSTSSPGGGVPKIGMARYFTADWRKLDVAGARRVRKTGFSGAHIFIDRPLQAELREFKCVKATYDEAGLVVAQTNGSYECLINFDEVTRAKRILILNATQPLAAADCSLASLGCIG